MAKTTAEFEIRHFESSKEWAEWLDSNYNVCDGLWLRLAKKNASLQSVTYAEALEEALCHGWIDGQRKSYDDESWLQKFTPRRPRSIWSKVNREKVLVLIESGRMKEAGLKEIERARADGRWDAAYDSATSARVPEDLQLALDNSPAAKAFFESLKGNNRYAILFRIQTVKKAETRAKKIEQFVAMLGKGETIYP
jgi:uncharacterized protein YdeI (YjbR/CyaY-like superfamily)